MNCSGYRIQVGDNMKNVRHETCSVFRNKKRKYLKEEMNAFKMNSKNKNIRDLYRCTNELKKGYQPKLTS